MSQTPSIYTPKDIYDCDGVTFEFPVTFPVDRDTDIFAFLITVATGVPRRMVRNQDYKIVTDSDGNRTLVTRVDEHRDPWPAGVRLTIMRRMQFTQPSGKSTMNAKVFSNRIDSLTRMFQQLREKLDRTLHIGLAYPFYGKTSKPYALLIQDALTVGSQPRSRLGLFRMIDDTLYVFAVPTGGTMDVQKVTYDNWPAEAIDIVAAIPVDGELRVALLSYTDGEPDELDIVSSIPVDGTLRVAIVSYGNWPLEPIEVVSVPTGGTVS